jgi:uncharacterized membrane-anchored protein YjiN (DUF445 family)
MTDYKATSDQWNQVQKCADVVGSSDCSAILELRARIETLEAATHKHVVETNSNIVALFTRVESLEAAEREASKVYQISKPLRLTPDQVQQALDQLLPKIKPSPDSSQIESSLVQQVGDALMESIKDQNSMARTAIRKVALWLNEAPLDLWPVDRGIVVNALYDQANQ